MTLSSGDAVTWIIGLINAIVLLLLKRGLSTLDTLASDITEIKEGHGRFDERLKNLAQDHAEHRRDDRQEFRDLWDVMNASTRPFRRPPEER